MTPARYCLQKVLEKDPGFRFVLKSIPVAALPAVTALLAFYEEIDAVIFATQEPMVAFAKLNWWRLEVSRMIEGQSVDHPVMLALQAARKATPFAAERLLDLIDGVAQNVELAPFPNFEAVAVHVLHTAGIRERLIAEACGGSAISSETIYQLALVLEITRYIQHLHRYVRRGIAVMGEDELRQFKVTAPMLQACQTTPEIKALLAFQVQKVERANQQALAALSIAERRLIANLVLRCQLAVTLLDEIRKSDYRVLEELIQLTGLRGWWVVYRARAGMMG
jgi:phytoene synthase